MALKIVQPAPKTTKKVKPPKARPKTGRILYVAYTNSDMGTLLAKDANLTQCYEKAKQQGYDQPYISVVKE